MLDRVESVTLSLVSQALDAATLRHQAIAANIANVNTPGYRPVRVSFEEQLTAAGSQLNNGGTLRASDLFGVVPRLERAAVAQTGSHGAGLDMLTAEMAQNTVQYQALLKGVSHHFSILSTIINEGKR
ncbi:flagellar basal body rod protein FlgB [Chitinimonas sp. JJ19]|uniref:flagellar basal body rod protein FlgB n=1 Tax=Chitinimonas sp. JJ19 TaxID=3109352 RepID=UPI003002B202